MVNLVGVHHAGFNVFLGEFKMNDFAVYPSENLLRILLRSPKETKIGLESLSEKDWKEVKEDLKNQVGENYDSLKLDDGINYIPSFSDVFDEYWNSLKVYLNKMDLDVVFLDNKELFLRYNELTIKKAKLEVEIKKKLFQRKGESDFEYSKKLYGFNEERYNLEIKERKVHELERDTKLLEKIKSSRVNIAVVGQGHSDFWFGNREFIQEKYGIDIEKYSTDLMIPLFDGGEHRMTLTENADSDPKLLFEREGLERSIRLVEQGRVTEHGKPDYVGVWDIPEPSKGYFEVFIDKIEEKNISGFIHDLLGVATFKGTLNDGSMNFVKRYGSLSSSNAMKQDVNYKAVRKDNNFYGLFYANGFARPFCMIKSVKEKPIDLSLKFAKFHGENPEFYEELKI